jgi:hypothetical protein
MALLLGPVSNVGRGPIMAWLGILVPGLVAVTAWTRYLRRQDGEAVPVQSLVWVTAVCAIMVALGIYDLLR